MWHVGIASVGNLKKTSKNLQCRDSCEITGDVGKLVDRLWSVSFLSEISFTSFPSISQARTRPERSHPPFLISKSRLPQSCRLLCPSPNAALTLFLVVPPILPLKFLSSWLPADPIRSSCVLPISNWWLWASCFVPSSAWALSLEALLRTALSSKVFYPGSPCLLLPDDKAPAITPPPRMSPLC